jgi:glucose/mannose-6-phosphate isomerase
VPFTVVRDYTFPKYVGPKTLVVAVSHSGNTEETLSCYVQARQRKAKLLAVSTGGDLAAQARRDKVSLVKYGYPGQPRAALPMVLGIWLKLLPALRLAPDQAEAAAAAEQHITEIVDHVRHTKRHQAADLADQLTGRVPIIYGAGFLGEAARRLKGQISENAKQTAAWEVVPEQNHNALVGYEFPDGLAKAVTFVLLRSTFEHPRHGVRLDFVRELIGQRHLAAVELAATGPNKLSHLVSSAFWGDLTSVELASRNGVDPTPVDVIDQLKGRLAES